MQVNQLSAEQLKAVIRFAAEHGRTWKSQLNDAWMTGNYVGFVGSHLLQQVRNQFGPEWLVKFNLKKALAAQVAAPVANSFAGQSDAGFNANYAKLEEARKADREAAAYQPKIVLDAITNALPPKPVYKIVQTVEGRMVATRPTSIHAWAHANGRAVYNVARVAHLRPELQCQPHVQGLLGPMWDGLNQDGAPVIRYEDDQTYNTLSR